jgi:hypothetical protein
MLEFAGSNPSASHQILFDTFKIGGLKAVGSVMNSPFVESPLLG